MSAPTVPKDTPTGGSSSWGQSGATRHARARTDVLKQHFDHCSRGHLTCSHASKLVLGVKGSQVQILSARRRETVSPPGNTAGGRPFLRSGKGSVAIVTSRPRGRSTGT